jgi:hypothetical protein
MKHIVIAVLFLVTASLSASPPKEVNLSTLLQEMVDREQITRFPENGYRCLQASSYNRESVSPDKPGWFADSDGIGYIRTEINNGQTEWVLMEDEGPGVITKIWAVCFYYGLNNTTGANIKFYLDGETEPTIHTNFFELVKGQDFVKPPFADASTRAGNLYFPIPYAKSCKITMDNKSFYNIINYRKYPPGIRVRTFTMEEFNQTVDLRSEVAAQLATPPAAKGQLAQQTKKLHKGESLCIALPEGGHALTHLEIKVNSHTNLPQALRSTVLIDEFDGAQTVWSPVGDFFNNVGKAQPFDMWERSVQPDGTMVCRWFMPYRKTGAISLTNLWHEPVEVSLKAVTDPYAWDEHSMHFYASWRMDPPSPTFPLYDWNFLSARGKGVVVGDQWTVLNPREGWWGEGDEKIYVDDDFQQNFPSHFGTGTEDYYGWAGGIVPTPADEFSHPFLGNIIVGHPRSMGYNVCTRTRVLDAIPFNQRIQFDFESSCGTRQRWHYLQYAQTTFWYGAPGVTHNRLPLPEMASKILPTLAGLQKRVEEAKQEQYIVDGALEAENMRISNKSDSVSDAHATIPMWGEMSSGAMQQLWFAKEGDSAEITLTEQFSNARLQFCAAVGRHCGIFDVYINGLLKATQDFYSNHGGMTNPMVDLGENEPIDNAFTVTFVIKGNNSAARALKEKFALGIDYFLVDTRSIKTYVLENNSLSRTFTVEADRLCTTGIHNKLASQHLTPPPCDELRLRLSQGTHTTGTDRILTARDFQVRAVHEYPLNDEGLGQGLCFVLENSENQLTVAVHYELGEHDVYLHKYLDITCAQPVTLERIDVDVIGAADAHQPYQIKAIYARGKWSPGLGQPLFTTQSGTFWGVEFPASYNYVKDKTLNCGYLWGREIKANTPYRTYRSVMGVADDPRYNSDAFYEYIDRIRIRPLRLQIQYNTWFDTGRGVNRDSFKKSVAKIHQELVTERGCQPLKAYVIDDGWQDTSVTADWSNKVWQVNSKFDTDFSQSLLTAQAADSHLGLWLSPGCNFGARKMVPRLKDQGFEALDNWMSLAGPKYMELLRQRMVELAAQGVTYFKLDGLFGHLNTRDFDLHGDRHDLPTMPQLGLAKTRSDDKQLNDAIYDELKTYYLVAGSEKLIGVFQDMARVNPDVYIVISNGAWLSPWWLMHIDAVWMINAGDAAGGSSRTQELVYRDGVYHEIWARENTHFPMHSLFNHEPKKRKTGESQDAFRDYLYMNLSRGTGFIELYIKTFVLQETDWDVVSEGLHWVYQVFPTFQHVRMHGGNPKEGAVYGFTAWNQTRGYVSLHNPGDRAQTYTFTLDRALGVIPNSGPFQVSAPEKRYLKGLQEQYRYGNTVSLKLAAQEVRIIDFSHTTR